MNYLIVLFLVLFITGCAFENTRQSIGITTNPLSSKFEDKTKLQWKITFGKIRSKTAEEDED